MADPPKEEDRRRHSPPGDCACRHSETSGVEESTAQESKRRTSVTHGLKESGHKVVEAVGTLFKDTRGEEVDREDDPEYRCSQPAWEDDLKQYLPQSDEYGPGPSTRPTPPGLSNVASTSSRPPMGPTEGSGNASVDLLLGIKKIPQSLAAYRWHKAYRFVKKQNAKKKKAMSIPLGTGAKLHGRSLG